MLEFGIVVIESTLSDDAVTEEFADDLVIHSGSGNKPPMLGGCARRADQVACCRVFCEKLQKEVGGRSHYRIVQA